MYKFLIPSIFLFLLGAFQAQDHVIYSNTGAKYIGKIKKGDKGKGYGVFRMKENGSIERGNKYIGEFQNNKFHGKGTMKIMPTKIEFAKEIEKLNDLPPSSLKRTTKEAAIYMKRNEYEGDWKNGQKHGDGVYSWINGDKYVGKFRNDNFFKGRKVWSNGDVYNGYWENSQMHGYGKLEKADGEIQEGEFVRNKLLASGVCVGNCVNGYGTILYPSGNRYEGNWKYQKQYGKGTLSLKNGDKYVGEFLDGYRNGQGTYYWENGDKYVGEFVKNKRTGYGSYSYKNGELYIGDFKDDKKHGNGIFTYRDGKKCEGRWSKNEKLSNGDYTVTQPDGSITYEFYRDKILIGTTKEELKDYENKLEIQRQNQAIENQKKRIEYLKRIEEQEEIERERKEKIRKETAKAYCYMSKEETKDFIEKGLRSWTWEGAQLSFQSFGFQPEISITNYSTLYGKGNLLGKYKVIGTNRIYISDLKFSSGYFDASQNSPTTGYAKIVCDGDLEFNGKTWELNR